MPLFFGEAFENRDGCGVRSGAAIASIPLCVCAGRICQHISMFVSRDSNVSTHFCEKNVESRVLGCEGAEEVADSPDPVLCCCLSRLIAQSNQTQRDKAVGIQLERLCEGCDEGFASAQSLLNRFQLTF